jgi:hypothetical protein
MEHYVTLFDSLFLPQGLALHMSMERHVKKYTLWILCVDDEAHAVLTKLQLPNVRLLLLSKLETEELLRVKPTRSKGEYCWTLTPFAPRFVFEEDSTVERVTYLDADLWFRKHPGVLFEELEISGKDVLITDHSYSPEYDHSSVSGQYCVQFLIFNRNQGAQEIRMWWEDRCIEWCYDRQEYGLFGDQMYLNSWPTYFKDSVHILQNKELIVGPWNARRFPYGNSVAFHFHGLRIGKYIQLTGGYVLPIPLIENVYLPYIKDIKEAKNQLQLNGWHIKLQKTKFWYRNILISITIAWMRRIIWALKYSKIKI